MLLARVATHPWLTLVARSRLALAHQTAFNCISTSGCVASVGAVLRQFSLTRQHVASKKPFQAPLLHNGWLYLALARAVKQGWELADCWLLGSLNYLSFC